MGTHSKIGYLMFGQIHKQPHLAVPSALVLLAGLLWGALPAQAADDPTQLAPEARHLTTQKSVARYLTQKHYNKKPLDDDLSSEFFDAYLQTLDPAHAYFDRADVASFEKYRYALDDAINTASLEAAFEIYTVFAQKRAHRMQGLLKILEAGVEQFRFDRDEYYEFDRQEAPWAEGDAELDDLWHKRLKASIISMLLQPKTKDEIIETLTKRYKGNLRRIGQVSSEDVFQIYINALTQLYDPHTQYLAPKTSENFHINMSLSLEGIGALLKLEDEHTTVSSLVPAGPAEKGGDLKPNDRIIAVGQGESGELVDIVGWRLDNVVELIRGPKGSIVRLEVTSATHPTSHIISITRNTVKLQEQSAKATLMKIDYEDAEHTFAVIDIPIFYSDFSCIRSGGPNCRSTTQDVYNLLKQLQDKQPEGVIIDLRNNGGGSLQEANGLTGLFIGPGPTVQVRNNKNKIDIFSNTGVKTYYRGPLVVLTNRLSASASEIFAGAIQDYGRGLVVGTRTYGKGTVQVLASLNPGQLKITQAKFYRVSGLSTQHRGVLPDIQLPAVYNPEDIGESILDHALPGDTIRRARYHQSHQIKSLFVPLRQLHEVRVEKDKGLQYINNIYARNEERRQKKQVSLHLVQRQQEDDQDKDWSLEQENIKRASRCLPNVTSIEALEALEKDESVADEERLLGCQSDPDYGLIVQIEEFHANQPDEEAAPQQMTAIGAAQPDLLASADAETGTKEKPDIDDSLLVESARILIDYIQLRKRQASLNP